MPTSLFDDLPESLKSVRTAPLFTMRLDVRPLQIVGSSPGVYRRVGVVSGGSFEGQRLTGEVLEGGSDWQAVRDDGSTTLDVRLVLRTTDDALIGMTYRGPAPWPARCHCETRKGRGGRAGKLLLPDQSVVRDSRREIRLAQSRHRNRHRRSSGRWADLHHL
jgi:hypothetical protein